MTGHNRNWTRWVLAAAKVSMCALVGWFIYRAFVNGSETLSGHEWHVEPEWLFLSGALYLLGVMPAAIFWYAVLRKTGQMVTFGESLRAYYISQLGKYVPGKWMVILLRRTLLISRDVETTVVAASVFFETLSFLAVGSAISALVLVIWHREQVLLIAAAIGSMFLLGVPTIPSVFQWLIHVLRVGKLNPTAGERFTRIGWRAIVFGWLGMSLGWLVQGMALWATLRGLAATTTGPLVELSLHTTSVALGIVAGFLSQIPGGLVMREWVSGELMQPLYGAAMGIISAVIFRFVQIVSELSISIILYAAGWRRLRATVAPLKAGIGASAEH